MLRVTKEEIERAIAQSFSMSEAAAKLQMHFSSFKRHASKHGLYIPNQGGKGVKKPKQDNVGKIPLADILNGKHPQYQTYKLKNRLIAARILKYVCSCCGISSWNGEKLALHLDHIDGNRTNHSLENLRMLCPNCHSQTSTFGNKRGKRGCSPIGSRQRT